MYCGKCGNKLEEGAIFCTKCGTKVNKGTESIANQSAQLKNHHISQVSEKTKKEKTKNKKLPLYIGISVACLVLLFVGIILGSRNTDMNYFREELKKGNYKNAYLYYGNLSVSERMEVEKILSEEANKTVEAYNQGTITYDEASDMLGQLEQMDYPEKEITSKKLKNLKVSKIAFENAADEEQKGNLLQAIEEYQDVTENDGDYAEAQEKIESLTDNYKKDLFEKVNELIEAEKYEEAGVLLKEGKKILQNDDEYIELVESAESLHLEQKMNTSIAEAETLKLEGNYSEAIKILGKIEQDNIDVDSLLAQYITEYKNLVLNEAASLAAEEKYEEAVKVLEAAVQTDTLPVPELQDKIREYEDMYPVFLRDLEPILNHYFEVAEAGDIKKDIYGNEYQGGIFSEDYRYAEVEYVVDGQYTKFKSRIVIVGSASDENRSVIFYADDKELYSTQLNRKTKVFEVEIDITKVQFFKIQVNSSSANGQVYFQNAQFCK